MSVYAIWNRKGGTGKTTTTVNLAYLFSLAGKRVLVIDLDAQVNATPFFTKANKNGKTIVDVLHDPKNMKKCIFRSKYQNIDIVKGSEDLREEDTNESLTRLCIAIGEVDDHYDAVFIDCPPSGEYITQNAIFSADVLLTPILLDGYCRDNLSLVQKTYQQAMMELSFAGAYCEWVVFANRVRNYRAQHNIYRELVETHDYPLADTCISERTAVSTASTLRKPLYKHSRKNAVTKDYIDLAKELLAKEGTSWQI